MNNETKSVYGKAWKKGGEEYNNIMQKFCIVFRFMLLYIIKINPNKLSGIRARILRK